MQREKSILVNKSLDWFTCYLSNRKQFISNNVNSKSTLLDIVCRAARLWFPSIIKIIRYICWWYKLILGEVKIWLKGSEIHLCTMTNEKLTIDNKQIAHMSGANILLAKELFLIKLWFNFKKKNFIPPFYRWGSTVSRLQSQYKETVYILPISPQEFQVLIS